MKKICLYICLSLLLLGLIIAMVLAEIQTWPVCGVLGLIAGILSTIWWEKTVDLQDNADWKTQRRKLIRAHLLQNDDFVRISFAYLFRIKIGDKYLLVKNQRGTGKWQPVGGVYKMNPEEALYLQSQFSVADDNKIPIDTSSSLDYRLYVPCKSLPAFVKRFDKTKNREQIKDLRREFREELLQTGIVDTDVFAKIRYRYCGRQFNGVSYSEHFHCYELLLADIVDVQLDDKQTLSLRAMTDMPSETFYFATSEEIDTLGVNGSSIAETIADHSKKILQESELKLIKPKRAESFEVPTCT